MARFAINSAVMIAITASVATQWMAFGQTRAAYKVSSPVADQSSATSHSCGKSANVTRTQQMHAFRASLAGDIMAFAYDLPPDRIERKPQWMYDNCFDVEVTTAGPHTLAEQKQMLQKLLEQRFGLVAHRNSYPSAVYFLVRGAKDNLTKAAEPNAVDIPIFREEPTQPGFPVARAVYAEHASTGDLAAWLYQWLQLPVVDKTGLTGSFDMEITGLPPGSTGDRIIPAVRDSLGLDLERHEGTAESLIIDRIEKPTQ